MSEPPEGRERWTTRGFEVERTRAGREGLAPAAAPCRWACDGREPRPAALAPWRRRPALLPEGTELLSVWARRHRWILTILWLHVPGVFAFALVRGNSRRTPSSRRSAVAAFALISTQSQRFRRLSTVSAAVGLLTSSAVLVHLSEGSIEIHFHFFVMVGVVTLYQDWWPFLAAIGYVVVQHGVAGPSPRSRCTTTSPPSTTRGSGLACTGCSSWP